MAMKTGKKVSEKKKVLTSKHVDTPQQTVMIETPAGVKRESVNPVYHNEALTPCCFTRAS